MKKIVFLLFAVALASFNVYADDDDGRVRVNTYSVAPADTQPGAYFLTIDYKVADRWGREGSYSYELDIDIYQDGFKIGEIENVYRVSTDDGTDKVTLMFFPRRNANVRPKAVTLRVKAEDLRPGNGRSAPDQPMTGGWGNGGQNVSPQ
jgi:hypothetical protein